jgi:hypothetical protein
MPFYKVLYKTEADPDGRFWIFGPLPNDAHAVASFNVIARKEGLGKFTLDEIDAFLPDYNLVVQETVNGPPEMFPLYQAFKLFNYRGVRVEAAGTKKEFVFDVIARTSDEACEVIRSDKRNADLSLFLVVDPNLTANPTHADDRKGPARILTAGPI